MTSREGAVHPRGRPPEQINARSPSSQDAFAIIATVSVGLSTGMLPNPK